MLLRISAILLIAAATCFVAAEEGHDSETCTGGCLATIQKLDKIKNRVLRSEPDTLLKNALLDLAEEMIDDEDPTMYSFGVELGTRNRIGFFKQKVIVGQTIIPQYNNLLRALKRPSYQIYSTRD